MGKMILTKQLKVGNVVQVTDKARASYGAVGIVHTIDPETGWLNVAFLDPATGRSIDLSYTRQEVELVGDAVFIPEVKP